MQHFVYHFALEVPIDIIIYRNYRRLAATTDTTDCLQGEIQIFGVFADTYAKFLSHVLEYATAALDITCRTHAHFDNIFAFFGD